ncbi:MAG: diguanylate cyclase, partial [Treponema sp.]|nr:diguanylate cyclase [Treponema sp.]
MKKKSIMTKMLQAFLLVCLVSLAASGATSLMSLLKIRDLTIESNNNIGSAAAGSGSESLRDQVLLDISELVQAESDIIDLQLQVVGDAVVMLKGYIEKIYSGKEDFRLIKIPGKREVPPGELRLHWFIEAGKIPDMQYVEDDLVQAGLLEEAYLLGNLERINQILMEITPAISTIYVTTESGLNIQYDRDAALKAYLPASVLRDRPWYRAARDRNGMYISDAYRDMAGRGLSISITIPFSNKEGEFAGVVGIDIKIEDLDESIRETVVAKSGYAVLLNNEAGEDGKGTGIVSAPGLNEQNENDTAAFLGSNADLILAEMKSRSSGGGRSTIRTADRTMEVYVIWAPVKLTNWQLAYIVPDEDIQAP